MTGEAREFTRLANILERLDSPYDGERAAAALLASRAVRRLGLTWTELLAPRPAPPLRPPPHWRDLVAQCRQRSDDLTAWERGFLATLASYRGAISQRQRDALGKIAAKVRTSRG